MQQSHEEYVSSHMESQEQKDAANRKDMNKLSNENEHKLAMEIARYDTVCEKLEHSTQEADEKLAKLTRRYEDAAAGALRERKREMKELRAHLVDSKVEGEASHKIFEEELRQQVNESDEQVAKLKHMRLADRDEHDAVLAKRQGLLNSSNDSFKKMKKKMEQMAAVERERTRAHNVLKENYLELKDKLRCLEVSIVAHEEEIEKLQKDKLNLKSNCRTLDNFRYVLDHRIKQLTNEKGPISDHITELQVRHTHTHTIWFHAHAILTQPSGITHAFLSCWRTQKVPYYRFASLYREYTI